MYSFSDFFDDFYQSTFEQVTDELGREPTEDQIYFIMIDKYEKYLSDSDDMYESSMRGE